MCSSDLILRPNVILFLILIMSVPRLISLFSKRSEEEQRYFEVTPFQRVTMGTLYFGLIALLVLGMGLTHIPPEKLNSSPAPTEDTAPTANNAA